VEVMSPRLIGNTCYTISISIVTKWIGISRPDAIENEGRNCTIGDEISFLTS